jgi:uncharacterized membrane protein
MNWLPLLLPDDIPEGTTLSATALTFRGWFPWWAAMLFAVMAGTAVFILYASEHNRLGISRRLLLSLLRTAALTLLAVLLLRPVLVAEYKGERPRGVALLIDNSQSMTQRDKRLSAGDRLRVAIAEDRTSPDTNLTEAISSTNFPAGISTNPARADLVRAVLSNPRLNLIERLGRTGPVRAFFFGRRIRPFGLDELHGGEGALPFSTYRPDESGTALADALVELLQREDGDLPSAVVVMTDGQDNASKRTLSEAARECGRRNVSLHIYGVGASEGGVLQLLNVTAPSALFAQDVVNVPIRWHASGFKQAGVEFLLTLGGEVVVHRPATPEETARRQAVLQFTPKKGSTPDTKLDLVATVQLMEDASCQDSLRRQVRLVDRRLKVLVVESSPRWEYKFLQSALLRDRRVEAAFLLINADPEVLRSGPPFIPMFPARDKLFEYDLVILGEVSAEALGARGPETLRDFVKEGGGLVFLAGRQHALASYTPTALAEVLPVEFPSIAVRFDDETRPKPFAPVLTEAGRRSDVLALTDTAEDNLRIWKELPGFYWHYPISKLRAGATALLEHPTERTGDGPMPLLASHLYGKGQVLFLASDETWRWRFNAGDKYFGRFWGQVVYHAGLPHVIGGSRRVQLAMDRVDARFGRPGTVYARLFDADFLPLHEDRVTARLEQIDAPGGTSASRLITLEAVPGQSGEYRALLPHDVVGQFELHVDGPDPAVLPYRVRLPVGHELEATGMAEDALREAAALSGGRFYREENLVNLPGQIEPRSVAFTRSREVLLWNSTALLLFFALVTTEWLVRKFANLS